MSSPLSAKNSVESSVHFISDLLAGFQRLLDLLCFPGELGGRLEAVMLCVTPPSSSCLDPGVVWNLMKFLMNGTYGQTL